MDMKYWFEIKLFYLECMKLAQSRDMLSNSLHKTQNADEINSGSSEIGRDLLAA